MTRVIAGHARGRRLKVPSAGTRPTSDRVREALFASVESRLLAQGRTWAEVTVCDAYAGSGAIALEAWSRGSTRVCAIEKNTSALRVIEANVASVEAGSDVRVIPLGVDVAFARSPQDGACDVLFLDPPYDVPASEVAQVLAAAHANGWVGDEAIVVVERSARDNADPFPAGGCFVDVQQRRYGESELWYGRGVADEGGSP